MGRYTTWFQIALSHEYYVKDACPVSLIPSKETALFFRKSNILFRRQNANKWLMIKEEKQPVEELWNDEYPTLSFELYPMDKNFYYLSAGMVDNDYFTVKNIMVPNVWKTIEIDLKNLINKRPEEIQINISSVEKYYEYVLIPKYHKTETNIRLAEERSKVHFKKLEKIALPGIPEAFRFVTEEKIKLKQDIGLKVQLWESKESGERLISECIPNPQPDQCSIIDPKNVLTTYFYY